LSAKIDAVRQRQLARPIDSVGLAAHIDFPGIRARFAASTSIFLIPENAADFSVASADVENGNTAI